MKKRRWWPRTRLGTFVVVAAMAAITAGVVSAASVVPTLIPGANNDGKTCDEIYGEGTTTQIQGLDVSAGSHVVSSGGLSVTYTTPSSLAPPNASIDFQAGSGTTVIGVVVKDGVDGANWYDYSPDGVKSDTLLTTPGPPDGTFKGISHINFCVIETPKAEPEITTEAKTDGEGEAGDTLTDTASLTGGSTDPVMGGTVTFKLYNMDDDPTCEDDPIFEDTQNVTGEADGTAEVTSAGYIVLAAGTYTWIAEYSGDDNNEPAGPTDCGEESETLLFNAAASDVTTEIHLDPETTPPTPVTEIDLGDSVHDSATVSGPDTLDTPEGSVDFYFYRGECGDETNLLFSDLDNELVDGAFDPSDSSGALGAGSYWFRAHFNSDDTDVWSDGDSLCEPLTVDKAELTADTILHNADHDEIADGGHVPLGTEMHDTAQITGQVDGFDPENDVTFAFYSEAECGGDPVAKDNVGPDEESDDPRSAATAALAPGTYGFKASIAGDDNYEGATSDCEPFIVDKGDLSIITYIHDADHDVVTFVPNGGTVHDTAAVSGAVAGFDPDLTKVGFAFYNTIDCTGDGTLKANTGLDSVSGDPRSEDVGPLASGAYSFRARFAGDANYNPVPGGDVACEPLSVRTFGKTMGYWGNNNGQARLLANNAFSAANAVTLGLPDVDATHLRCNATIDSAAESKTVFPSTLNGISLTDLDECDTSGERDSGINVNSLNTLLAQTLALSYNIKYVSGFAGQPIISMGCTPVGTLTNTSDVGDALDYANYLIGNAIKNNGSDVITQAQIGAMNTLLGCMNAEA